MRFTIKTTEHNNNVQQKLQCYYNILALPFWLFMKFTAWVAAWCTRLQRCCFLSTILQASKGMCACAREGYAIELLGFFCVCWMLYEYSIVALEWAFTPLELFSYVTIAFVLCLHKWFLTWIWYVCMCSSILWDEGLSICSYLNRNEGIYATVM